MTDQIFLLLASTGFLGGFIDSIAGGGGLITLPVLLSIGIPPHIALGTNKLAATFGSFNTSRIFIQRKILNPRLWKACILAAAIGALIGVVINYFLPAHFLRQFLPVLIIAAAVYVGIFKPDKNRDFNQFKNFKPPRTSSFLLGNLLGFYDGCFGPGTGSFWTCFVMAKYKMDLLSASGVARVMNFISNFVALLTFIILNNINYTIGIIMGLGLLAGSYVGAHSAIRFGAKFIRPVFLTVVIAIAIHILWQEYL